jgi:hypothetical protein
MKTLPSLFRDKIRLVAPLLPLSAAQNGNHRWFGVALSLRNHRLKPPFALRPNIASLAVFGRVKIGCWLLATIFIWFCAYGRHVG